MVHTRSAGLFALVGAGLVAGLIPGAAHAQSDSPLIQPAIPDGFDRGRNISVTQRPRPDYDPLGLLISSFKVYPKVETGIGATDNVFVSGVDPQADGFVYVTPGVTASSDWSRHSVQLRAATQLRRFFDNPRRNENAWNVGALGRLDLASSYALTGEAQFARIYETPFSGEVSSDVAVLSSYFRSFLAARGQYQRGQGRLTLAVDRGSYDFSPIPLAGGTFRDQSDRNRKIVRGSGQVEYAFTPSFSVYTQFQYTDTAYDRPLLGGGPNRDSTSIRAIAGVSLDLAGLMRGSVGVGYTRRNYRSLIYPDAGGFSAEGKLEYFPTELTTVTLGLSRVLQDSAIGSSSAYFDNRIGLRVDHELLNNLLLNANADFGQQEYIGIAGHTNQYRVGGGAHYLISHFVALDGSLSYAHQDTTNTAIGRSYGETRGQVGVTLQF